MCCCAISVAATPRKLYLKKLGIPYEKYSEGDQDRLYRGLHVQEADIPLLSKRIHQLGNGKHSVETILTKLYGYEQYMMGIEVVGGNKKSVDTLSKMIDGVCEPVMSYCAFFNMAVLDKVLLIPQNGMAAFFPERSTLILSQGLLEDPNLLHKVVVLHELTHVWERANPAKEFGEFSGWKKKGRKLTIAKPPIEKDERHDPLTELSKKSPFSLLPDPLLLGQEGRDGFVTRRSYQSSLERADVSEDLADHVAIYRYLPSRFCDGNKNIAPKKSEWISTHVFPKLPKINCATSS